jgi:hypothetical protein
MLAQVPRAGFYESGLTISYDPLSRMIRGSYEDYSGWDEELKLPMFSCVFMFEAKAEGKEMDIKSFFPGEEDSLFIPGRLQILSSEKITLQLRESPGGCSAAARLADTAMVFSISEALPFIGLKYVNADEAFFYAEPDEKKKEKSYLVRNDLVGVLEINGAWVRVLYQGDQRKIGWMRAEDLR